MHKSAERRYVRFFEEITLDEVPQFGGKNASLGEMVRELSALGVRVPPGFAVTAAAYRETLRRGGLEERIAQILADLDTSDVGNLAARGKEVRELILAAPLPGEVEEDIRAAYRELAGRAGEEFQMAVRSSATAEDLPDASFAGQQETFLNVRGEEDLLRACRRCFASLFTDRAISYRTDKGFDQRSVALSVGVQVMVRSDLATSGVIFTIDTESGFSDVVLVSAAYGLGENVVQGTVNPDEYLVFKPTLHEGFRPIIGKHLGSKRLRMVYDDSGRNPTKNIRVSRADQERFALDDDDVLELSRWACRIEEHYSKRAKRRMPMDIEWAKDGTTGELFIVQARPETVVSQRPSGLLEQYVLKEKGELLTWGRAVGQRIGVGKARVIRTAREIEKFQAGEVLVIDATDPDWEPIMKIAAGVVTDRGGRTSHAAIVSRELGIPCIVGCGSATETIETGEEITVSCAEGDAGNVYRGRLSFDVTQLNLAELPAARTKIALNLGDPDSAFYYSFLPNDGVGLAREEFIISSTIGVHPLALLDFETLDDAALRYRIDEATHGYADKAEFFVERLSEGIGKIAAAFFPKPVIVRTSDFKSNEYARLIGGERYEPDEENPMIGWRGASRYYHPDYRRGFALECRAIKRVRKDFGLKNLIVMIPFCRTVAEAKEVLKTMADCGLTQGEDGLKIFGMCEIPSNVLLAEEFLEVFDGFSIGSNDLTQLTLGIDRDSTLISELFDERNDAVKKLIRSVIEVANRKGKYIGICGDAPSTFPDFAAFLVEAGIQTISLSPDALLVARMKIAETEKRVAGK